MSLPPFLSSALWGPSTQRKWLTGDNHHWQQLFWSPLKWCWKLFPGSCRRDKHISGPLQIDAVILSSNGLENWLVPITSGVNTWFSAPVGSGPGGPAVDNHCQQKVSQWKVIFSNANEEQRSRRSLTLTWSASKQTSTSWYWWCLSTSSLRSDDFVLSERMYFLCVCGLCLCNISNMEKVYF